MNHDEWLKSLNLPSRVGISTSKSFSVGQECQEIAKRDGHDWKA